MGLWMEMVCLDTLGIAFKVRMMMKRQTLGYHILGHTQIFPHILRLS